MNSKGIVQLEEKPRKKRKPESEATEVISFGPAEAFVRFKAASLNRGKVRTASDSEHSSSKELSS